MATILQIRMTVQFLETKHGNHCLQRSDTFHQRVMSVINGLTLCNEHFTGIISDMVTGHDWMSSDRFKKLNSTLRSFFLPTEAIIPATVLYTIRNISGAIEN